VGQGWRVCGCRAWHSWRCWVANEHNDNECNEHNGAMVNAGLSLGCMGEIPCCWEAGKLGRLAFQHTQHSGHIHRPYSVESRVIAAVPSNQRVPPGHPGSPGSGKTVSRQFHHRNLPAASKPSQTTAHGSTRPTLNPTHTHTRPLAPFSFSPPPPRFRLQRPTLNAPASLICLPSQPIFPL